MVDVQVHTTAATDQPEVPERRTRKRRRTTLSQSDSGGSSSTQSTRVTRSAARRQAALNSAPIIDGNSNPESQSNTITQPIPAATIASSTSALAPPQDATTSQPLPQTIAPQASAAPQPLPQTVAPQASAAPQPMSQAVAPQALPTTMFTFSSAAIPDTAVPKSVKKKKPVVKAKAEIYRFLPREMPSDMGGLQVRNISSLHL